MSDDEFEKGEDAFFFDWQKGARSQYAFDEDDWSVPQGGAQSWPSDLDLLNRQRLLCDSYAGDRKEGARVKLPDGELIKDDYSPTGYLMGPAASNGADLSAVAEAGRDLHDTLLFKSVGVGFKRMFHLLYQGIHDNVAHGGHFDTQRRHDPTGKDGYRQYPQFRDDANVNVGVFMQQVGFTKEMTLFISGFYALLWSHNAQPMSPQTYFLDPRTELFISTGYDIGASGVLDR
jgi:hypothetical protein